MPVRIEQDHAKPCNRVKTQVAGPIDGTPNISEIRFHIRREIELFLNFSKRG